MNRLAEFRDLFLRRADLGAVSPRVRAAIRERERLNELVARVIQITIIGLFCVLYAVSPKPAAPVSFNPAPSVLALYLALSLIGLVWAALRHLPRWASYASIIIDFGLLFALMVSFHFQYQQPASFILKAPSLLYVFIFIAIRALQFDPRYVLAAGGVASAGWAAIIVYVTQIDPADNMVTRSYVEYLTSNSVLIGAEIDKIISILFVTGILALAVNGSANLLVRAVAEQAAADRLSMFFDRSVATGIRNSFAELKAGEGERRVATIMNVDIRGFTKLASDLEPSEVMRLLSQYQSRIVPVIQAHGGVVDKFMGDGVLATFGIAPHERPAAGALEAGFAILSLEDAWRSDPEAGDLALLRLGVGLACGPVAFGAVGLDGRLEMTAIGAAVNLSSRLEKYNKTLGSRLVCDASTLDAALASGFDPPPGFAEAEAQVDGLVGPVRIGHWGRVALAAPVWRERVAEGAQA